MQALRTFNILSKVLLIAMMSLSAVNVLGDELTRYYSEDGVAIGGYDPVAYFTKSDAQRGKEKYSYSWMQVTWHFASKENRTAFVANPTKYAPQYHGYCAYAAANNYIYSTDPKAWTVHNGKLYLNAGLGTRIRWAINKDNYISSANSNWPSLAAQLP